jgi:predicted SprT family Zn-dependent metalloprotease
MREGLASDEEYVEDLWVMKQIEEILCATYERKTRGPREETGGRNTYPYQCQCGTHKPMCD